jgi:hypothetical protein
MRVYIAGTPCTIVKPSFAIASSARRASNRATTCRHAPAQEAPSSIEASPYTW